jgi:rhodanese-related sulfurtransferase
MKKLALTILLAAAAAFGQQGETKKGPASQAHVLTSAEFDALLAHPDQLLIVDVRRPDEITSNGGFPVYLSIQAKQLAQSLAWIPKDRTIVTVSNHAARGGGHAHKGGLQSGGNHRRPNLRTGRREVDQDRSASAQSECEEGIAPAGLILGGNRFRVAGDHGTDPYALVVSFVRLSWAPALSGFDDRYIEMETRA